MENIFLLEGILSEAWSSIKNGGGSVFLRSAFSDLEVRRQMFKQIYCDIYLLSNQPYFYTVCE